MKVTIAVCLFLAPVLCIIAFDTLGLDAYMRSEHHQWSSYPANVAYGSGDARDKCLIFSFIFLLQDVVELLMTA